MLTLEPRERTGAPRGARALRLRSADGVSLHASLFSAPHARAGLLLVQGLQSHAGWFEASGTAAELARAGICSLACDRRGSGRSAGARGHVASADEFLLDLDAAHVALRRQLGAVAPVHVLANCFGARAALAYAAEHPGAFASLVLTAPATHMRARASYGLTAGLRIALSPARAPFPTPLRDEYFVREGPWLDWIRADALALRSVSAGFLRSASRLTRRMWSGLPRVRIPLFVILSRRDAIVDNEAIRRSFVARYPGPSRVLEYDVEHYVDFTDARWAFARELERWVQRPRP
jgi:alpha-beta hydrolase superfamily lysophospholipase